MAKLTAVSAIGGGSLLGCQRAVGWEQRVSTTHCTIQCEPGPPALIIVYGDLV
jgi:hypothetical protein